MRDTLLKCVSNQRLSRYGDINNLPIDQLLKRYLWNIEISESLYPHLSLIEITLRNRVNDTLNQVLGSDWLSPGQKILHPFEQSKVFEIKEKLKKINKDPSDTGNVLAELNFGFWISLFDKRYEQVFLHKGKTLETIFPNMPKQFRTRHNISVRLQKVRQIRNRIFHFEPIWHWSHLEGTEADLQYLLSTFDVKLKELIDKISRFKEVFIRKPL